MGRLPGTYNGARHPLDRPGTIGVISATRTVMPAFGRALAICGRPEGTKLIWTENVDVVGNCNLICRHFRGDWVWFMGDDHVFDPDILLRLLQHDVDVVVPLCLKRSPPFDPVVYSHQNERGEYVGADLPGSGLARVHAAGSAGMLIKRRVLDAIADPWFESHGGLNEDLTFCAKVRDAGFSIWCDVDSLLGHLATHTVWPARRDDGWHADLEIDAKLTLPILRIVKEQAVA